MCMGNKGFGSDEDGLDDRLIPTVNRSGRGRSEGGSGLFH